MYVNLNKLKVALVGVFALAIINTGQAQGGFSCGTDQKLKELYAKHPELKAEHDAFMHNVFSNGRYDSKERAVVYTIPIVFHILHQYGSENISDNNIYNQMIILNNDFRKLNADASAVIPQYQPLIADCRIQWVLPTIDPDGNCTNGIEHIYTHETTQGDDFSKLNQWPRDKYLNVWIADFIGVPGAAGYAFYPSAVAGEMAFADGIILQNGYIGSLAPSSAFTSRALTHEIGHYLNLSHTWGSTNDPDVACGDDGIPDTPVTKGHDNCSNKLDYFCDLVALSGSYKFDSLLVTSGSTDPTPPLSVLDSGLIFSSVSAVGVSANSETAGVFDFSGWDTGATDTASSYSYLTGSINTAKYYEFTVDPVFGQGLTLTGITFNVSRDTSGVRTYCVRSSKDGYASNLTATITPANTDLSVQTGNIFYIKNDTTSTEVGSKITLSGASFTNDTLPITFRIYGFNAEDPSGTFGVDNIAFIGNYGTIENVENFMEYSYCSKMFTLDQQFAMESTLNQDISYRSNLWSAENLAATGSDYALPATWPNASAPLCAPVVDFFPNEKYVCNGNSVTFTSKCWRGAVASYAWSFPGGTPSTSTSANPVVVYTTPGWHDVTLTATNATGSDTKTSVHAVYVSNTYADYTGPTTESFESSGTSDWWMTDNDENDIPLWHRVSLPGSATGSYCFMLNNHLDGAFFGFNQRLGGSVDALISPSYDLSKTTSGVLSFKYSCATHAMIPEDLKEELVVYTSVDCGKTWLPKKTINGTALANAGVSAGGFAPTSSSSVFWQTATINLGASMVQPNVRFKFEYTASDNSNNIYLDDINLSGVIGIAEPETASFYFDVYPNPLNSSETLTLNLEGSTESMQVSIYDVVGNVIYTKSIMNNGGKTTTEIPVSSLSISKGVYFVSVASKTHTQTKKVVIK